jgi:U4/U6.U5 tri-snRNP component SNU23
MSKKRAVEETEEGMAGRDAMGRRVWDKDFFKSKYESSSSSGAKRLVTGEAESLKHRSEDVGIDQKVSERKLVTNFTAKAQQGGFFCETCDCVLKDSRAYLDHINGRSHNRLLGKSMNVEKVTVERVIAKMLRIKQGLS